MHVSRIRLNKRGLGVLSPLETEVLELLWKKESARVRDIYADLKPRRAVALTSVAVMLDRLHAKGVVERRAEPGRGGYHYIYAAKTSKEEFENTVIERTVDKLIDTFGKTAVAYFNERFRGKK
ncbi:MAG: BlaI/MecI/CopY family transcriptional regulator [Candidatus Aenigmarchaeota archaeon]|nr:BlaI/MecI/CopY family transcriptional regulator [Candidatus Aenigmarchaeota archaeon]